jgi:hypothetical protein
MVQDAMYMVLWDAVAVDGNDGMNSGTRRQAWFLGVWISGLNVHRQSKEIKNKYWWCHSKKHQSAK